MKTFVSPPYFKKIIENKEKVREIGVTGQIIGVIGGVV